MDWGKRLVVSKLEKGMRWDGRGKEEGAKETYSLLLDLGNFDAGGFTVDGVFGCGDDAGGRSLALSLRVGGGCRSGGGGGDSRDAHFEGDE